MGLIPVGTTKEEWAARYEILLDPKPCANCGIDLYPEIPFAEDGWRGLKSAPHPCGPNYDLRRYARSTPEGRREMKMLYQDVKEYHKEGE